MAIKFPTSGTRVSQGMIFNDLEAPRPGPEADKPLPPRRDLEDAPATTHPQDHGWSN